MKDVFLGYVNPQPSLYLSWTIVLNGCLTTWMYKYHLFPADHAVCKYTSISKWFTNDPLTIGRFLSTIVIWVLGEQSWESGVMVLVNKGRGRISPRDSKTIPGPQHLPKKKKKAKGKNRKKSYGFGTSSTIMKIEGSKHPIYMLRPISRPDFGLYFSVENVLMFWFFKHP